jgi:predicted transcriptional regulator
MSDSLNRNLQYIPDMEIGSTGTAEFQMLPKKDIVAQILHAVRSNDVPAVKDRTELPSIPQLSEYLSLMSRNDLLKYDKASGTYKSTRKGEAYLKTYRQTQEFIQLIDEELGL